MRQFLSFFVTFAAVSAASALTIQLDYSYDAAAGNFFGQNALAKSAVDKAAADLSAVVTSVLTGIPDDVFTGTNGSTVATIDWELEISNPSVPGSAVVQSDFSMQTGVVKVYVGMRPLSGSTLGEGGPMGISFSAGIHGFASEGSGAVANAVAASDEVMMRNSGPIMGSLSGSMSSNPADVFTLNYGAIGGTLWFDNDRDNNGVADANNTLGNSWHFDPNTQVAAGKSDLYSVALHEMLHALGIGTSETWTNLVSGTTWLGTEAKLLKGGSGLGLVDLGGDHIASGLLSPRITDGVLQEVVMDPSLTVGTRKLLTQMDLAFLRDIGYTTVPEPSIGLMMVCGLGFLSFRRVRRN